MIRANSDSDTGTEDVHACSGGNAGPGEQHYTHKSSGHDEDINGTELIICQVSNHRSDREAYCVAEQQQVNGLEGRKANHITGKTIDLVDM